VGRALSSAFSANASGNSRSQNQDRSDLPCEGVACYLQEVCPLTLRRAATTILRVK
jgi:hypothetical protein